MDYKEEYQKALERAKMILCNLPEGSSSTRDIETIFPELKESEDERIRKEIVDFICWAIDRGSITKEQRERSDTWLAYLEKQKEPKDVSASTMAPGCWQGEEKSAEWSEEEKGILLECISALQNSSHWLLADKLSSLRPQPKQEWSDEDERLLNIIIDILDREEHNGHLMRGDLKACVKLLKSLRPQPHWKPSEEQISALEYFIRSWGESGTMSPQNTILCAAKSLLNDLKKL